MIFAKSTGVASYFIVSAAQGLSTDMLLKFGLGNFLFGESTSLIMKGAPMHSLCSTMAILEYRIPGGLFFTGGELVFARTDCLLILFSITLTVNGD
jgi:hypothetical protein